VYTGADAAFTLYEDAGDGYEYEGGAYALVKLRWDEAAGTLTIGAREGGFEGMVTEREYRVVFVSEGDRCLSSVVYRGEEIVVRKGGNA